MPVAAQMLIEAEGLSHRYGKVTALRDLRLAIPSGRTVAFIGPDGVGKSTLLGLIAGAKALQTGALSVFGGDVRRAAARHTLQRRVAYMPQGLGRNLYHDLSIRENLEFFGRLYGHDAAERARRIEQLLAATGLSPFLHRPAGKLSGGMKQKLGLCCALIHDPELLILDEPTTGVDPLSRKQFWALIDDIRRARPGLTVLVATSYMEEAERFETVVMLDAGRIIAEGTPAELKARCGADDLEKAFISFLPEEKRRDHEPPHAPPRDLSAKPVAIKAEGLTRRFGSFTAVDNVAFKIRTGEIFGFLGSNGCGKTTTMKMLTGLLPVSEGTSSLFGKPLVSGDMRNRMRIGYMSQAFSLYGELTVEQNLRLHAKLYGLEGEKAEARLAWIYEHFDLSLYRDAGSADLPLGVRQRLSLAVAVIHEPEILILDEPTSGVDPVARDKFWALLIDLAHHRDVTIFISTHFMNEAARCDRISLMHAGRVIATGTPEELRREKGAETLDAAFVSYLEEAVASGESGAGKADTAASLAAAPVPAREEKGRSAAAPSFFSVQRMLAYTWREFLEMWRDPVRLGMATLGTSLLMLVFGFGITLDVDSLRYAVLDYDRTPDSRAYLESFEGSSYFEAGAELASMQDAEERLRRGEISMALIVPPDFGRGLRRGGPVEVGALIDGAMPFRAETIGGYLQGIHQRFLGDRGLLPAMPLTVETRFRYNQSFESLNAMVPSVMGLLLVFIPSILSVLSVVREKEAGSISNLYVTPVSRTEFILGKQIPYIAFSLVGFLVMLAIALLVFGIPLKGSVLGLCLGAAAYVVVTTGIGLLVSSFTRSQAAALFATAILTMMPATQFSGMVRPVSTLEGAGYWIGTFFPTTYFLKISVGSFTKGLDLAALLPFIGVLLLFIPALLAMNVLFLKKQEA